MTAAMQLRFSSINMPHFSYTCSTIVIFKFVQRKYMNENVRMILFVSRISHDKTGGCYNKEQNDFVLKEYRVRRMLYVKQFV